ncbi:MAG: Lacal_2735 family protein [Verrucomicrobia bacterium]|nr:Lacal_2735 family protein [Kiritimatiellia bacterium]MCB1100861.1 Lacal_2735 family protein [Kiritimatiellia bacterium]MCP5489389.1 Lacal_2735 family protein [Verrucomicrobiota bacterium]
MGWFGGDKKKAAQKAYEAKMKEAMEAQRGGDIQAYAARNEEAQALLKKLQEYG